MADLSINVQQDSLRVRDFLLGAALGVALSAGMIEIPKISDSVQAALNPPPNLSVQVSNEGCRPIDRVYGATRYVQSQNALSAGLYEGNVKLSETQTVLRTLDPGLIQEVMRLDDFGQVDLYGLGAWVKVSDVVTATMQTGLFVGPLTELLHVSNDDAPNGAELFEFESLKITDTVTALLNPLQTSSPLESLKIADTVLGPTLNPLLGAPVAEALHVVDDNPPSATLVGGGNLAPPTLTESLKIADTVLGPTINPEQTGPSESLKVADIVLGPTLNPEFAAPSIETLHVQDSVTAMLDPLQTSPVESLKVDDFGQVDIYGLGAWIKISDTVTASLFGGLSVSVLAESLKIADFVTTGPLYLSVQVPDETIKIYDTDLTAVFSVDEVLHCVDGSLANGNLAVQLVAGADLTPSPTPAESLKIADTVLGPTINPEQASPPESLKVQDTATAVLDPLNAPTLTESLKVQDTVTPALWLAAQAGDETLHIQDIVISTLLNPLQTSGFDELIHVQDQTPNTGQNLAPPTLTESLKIADTVLGPTLDPEQASGFNESLKIADIVTASITPLLASGFDELLHVQDAVTPQLTVLLASGFDELLHIQDQTPQVGASISNSATEAGKLADQVFAQLDTLLATATESLKVADTVSQRITPLLASGFDEQAKVSDAVAQLITPLLAQASEVLSVVDKQPNFAGPSIIDVNGSYITKVDAGGSYIPHIDVIGQVE